MECVCVRVDYHLFPTKDMVPTPDTGTDLDSSSRSIPKCVFTAVLNFFLHRDCTLAPPKFSMSSSGHKDLAHIPEQDHGVSLAAPSSDLVRWYLKHRETVRLWGTNSIAVCGVELLQL